MPFCTLGTIALCSACMVDREVSVCIFDNHAKGVFPMKVIPPERLRRVSGSPAQSESEKLTMALPPPMVSPLCLSLYINFHRRISSLHASKTGLLVNLARFDTAYDIPGIVHISQYNTTPINFLNGKLLTYAR